jgi:hypothetical protein
MNPLSGRLSNEGAVSAVGDCFAVGFNVMLHVQKRNTDVDQSSGVTRFQKLRATRI